jgi:carboxymethylenebutenolidase
VKRAAISCLLLALLASAATGQSSPTIAPQIVQISSSNLHLKAFFWKPAGAGPFPAVLFSHGSGEGDAAHSAGMQITQAAERLAPVFLKHGYAFLYLFRRGQGPSADQAPFMQEILQHEETTNGKTARQHLQFVLLTTEQLEDVTAALHFLSTAPQVDSKRIAVAGHSFGGQLTLLLAEQDETIRAAVTFAAAAGSWQQSPELRKRLLTVVDSTSVPIMLIHAANDYDTTPGTALAAELDRLHKPHVLKIYPPVGQTPDDGHNLLYLAAPQWEADVFTFLDRYVKP